MKQNSFFSKQNTVVKVLLLVMIVWMLWFIGSAVAGQVRDFFVQSEEVHYKTMERVESGYGVMIAEEHVIYAAVDGTVEPVVAEGERVRKGNAVFRIGDEYQYTNYAGRVSYQLDELENVTDIGIVAEMDLKNSYNAQQKKKNQKPFVLTTGDPCAKVQETMGGFTFYVSVPNTNQTAEIGIGQTISVRLLDIDYLLKGEIVEVLNTADGKRCMKLEVANADDAVFQQRIYQLELPYESERVLAIPERALARKRGVDGVYYLHKGFVLWKEVTVSERWLDQGVLTIDAGLDEGDVVVTTPRMVKEGENIKF
ncbi:MAG: hypothetical protein IJE80_02005 [Peptococcaceae bacterium]|nr:hypothetical protein [Peptococcaceae bacterium]